MMTRRGTTPTFKFAFPSDVEVEDLTACVISFRQNGVSIDKALTDCTLDTTNNKLSVTLTQEETLELDASVQMVVQVRAKVGTTAMASQIFHLNIGSILKEGEI